MSHGHADHDYHDDHDASDQSPNGVTATAASDNYNNDCGQERVTVANTYPITALTITINVAQTAGVTVQQSGQWPSWRCPQADFDDFGGTITYSFVLAAGQTIPAGYPSGIVYTQFGGSGSPHVMAGDTWSVTSTSNGIASNLTGTF
jgi:hypothetical protein